MQTIDLQKTVTDLLNQGDFSEALQACEQQIAETPDDINTLALCAKVHRQMNDHINAEMVMKKVVELEPENQAMLVFYSMDLLMLGRVDEADSILTRIKPSHMNDPMYQLQKGLIHYHKHDFNVATKILVDLVSKHNTFKVAHLELARVLLMTGKWRAGWDAYEVRYHLPGTKSHLPKLDVPQWDGTPLDKSILLVADEEISDCIQFSRYIPLVARRCKRVLLLRNEPLARLLDSVPGVDESYTFADRLPSIETYCTLSSLPRALSTISNTVPGCDGVFNVHPGLNEVWKELVNSAAYRPKLKIGLSWHDGQSINGQSLRNIPKDLLIPLLDTQDCEFFSLQTGEYASQADDLGIINFSEKLTDLIEISAMIQALDLVITSDSSIAHLAASLGKPNWVCLEYTPDWRWGPSDSRTVWYKSVRLFRQSELRTWNTVIDEVKITLLELIIHAKPRVALETYMSRHNQNAIQFVKPLPSSIISGSTKTKLPIEFDMSKFILTGLPRSGTTVLSVSLASHPDILFYGELLNNELQVRKNESARITLGAGWQISNTPNNALRPCSPQESGYQYVNNFFSLRQPLGALGFKLLYDQALQGPNKDAWDYIEQNSNIKIIQTVRQNLLEIICSYVRANITKRWHVSNEKINNPRFVLPANECEILFKRFSHRPKALNNIYETHDVLDIEYSEIEKDFVDVMRKIFSFLEVDKKIEAKPQLSKIAALRPNEEIANYDELHEYFRNTEYGQYFTF